MWGFTAGSSQSMIGRAKRVRAFDPHQLELRRVGVRKFSVITLPHAVVHAIAHNERSKTAEVLRTTCPSFPLSFAHFHVPLLNSEASSCHVGCCTQKTHP